MQTIDAYMFFASSDKKTCCSENRLNRLARRLAEDTPEASRLRSAVSKSIAGDGSEKGGILAALRRSPLVGADLDLARSSEEGREIDI